MLLRGLSGDYARLPPFGQAVGYIPPNGEYRVIHPCPRRLSRGTPKLIDFESHPQTMQHTKEFENRAITDIEQRISAMRPEATRWGILLIVAIQLYLWIHLPELSPRLKDGDAGWDGCMVGVYRSLPARTLFVSSTALLPILTIVALGNNALREATALVWGIYIIALVASLLLAYLIVRSVPRRDLQRAGSVPQRAPDRHDNRN